MLFIRILFLTGPASNGMKEQIAIIDFGSQYTHLIARRIRQLGVLAKIYPPTVAFRDLRFAKGIILSGGPQSVFDKTAVKYNPHLFALAVPILGFCYGHQLIAQYFGGLVRAEKTKEYGSASLRKLGSAKLFLGLNRQERIWMSHGDQVVKLPPGFSAIGRTADCPVAAMADEKRNIYGLQFHPEVTHTAHGLTILRNFVFSVCYCQANWSMSQYYRQLIKEVKKTVGSRRVFLLVSGGVDSSVAFAVLEKTLGKKKVFGLHIDNGFMRLNESKKVAQALGRAGFSDLVVVDASDRFLLAVKGVTDPEVKREIIGRTFLKVKDDIMKQQNFKKPDWVLGQGTIYPDTIETGGTKHADKIKTHHNRVKEILKLMELGGLVEPLAELYKDEVRELGRLLGLPASLINRQPFPGPGLAIRALCGNGQNSVKSAAAINKKLRRLAGSKFKTMVLPLQSVGVQGDNRTYRHPALIAGPISWSKIHNLSVRITNEVLAVNRVVYLLHPQKFDAKDLKIKSAYLTSERLNLLRQVDDIVMTEIKRAGLTDEIWQFPVILAPLTLGRGETIILRPVQSKEAMTVNFYPLPQSILKRLVKKITAVPGVDLVLYDVTNKPPATIEWE